MDALAHGRDEKVRLTVSSHHMRVCELLSALVQVADKGASVARIIRSEPELLELLVEEKTGDAKNDRFVQDFKTLADVLIQEMVRHDLEKMFPGIERNVHGEESPSFTNSLGETVTIKMCETIAETAALLSRILDGNSKAAQLLAQVTHQVMALEPRSEYQHLSEDLDVGTVGVWIDPIDSTAQYIAGAVGSASEGGVVEEGLQCVAVLVGAFHQTSGLPIAGVANQPFWALDPNTKKWQGRTTWGVCYGDSTLSSLSVTPDTVNTGTASKKLRVVLSSSESPEVVKCLSETFELEYASGAGYKLLCAAQDYVDGYVLSKSSIYRWDCCGPHAILLAQGGGILSFSAARRHSFDLATLCTKDALHQHQIKYCDTEGGDKLPENNKIDGIIAYTSLSVLQKILAALQELEGGSAI